MATAKFIDDPDFVLTLERAGAMFPEVAEAALRAGAGVVADQMRINLAGILSPDATGELVAALGITPVHRNAQGDYHAHIGFDGYQQPGYGVWRSTGVPYVVIARSFESGAVIGGRRGRTGKPTKGDYWRKATPFAAPAVAMTAARRNQVMRQAAEREMEKSSTIHDGGILCRKLG